jgi:hypothetical protein
VFDSSTNFIDGSKFFLNNSVDANRPPPAVDDPMSPVAKSTPFAIKNIK